MEDIIPNSWIPTLNGLLLQKTFRFENHPTRWIAAYFINLPAVGWQKMNNNNKKNLSIFMKFSIHCSTIMEAFLDI